MNQSKYSHDRTFQAVGHNVRCALNDQLSRSAYSTRTSHLRKVGKLFDSSCDNLHLIFSCGRIIFRDEVIRGLELSGSLIGPPYLQVLACSWLPCPTGCLTHQRLMFDYFARIILANAFFDERAVVFLKRKILRDCFIDNEASVPLLSFGDSV